MHYFGKTDKGLRRKDNQDGFEIPEKNDDIKLFIVVDGMGGAKAGGVASKMAQEHVKKSITEKFYETNFEKEKIVELIRNSIIDANTYIYEESKKNKEYNGMGTTICVAIVYKNKVFIGHVGDSRIYRIRRQIMRQLTVDHSYVQELVKMGSITRKEAESHPQKNILMKVLGCEPEVEPDVSIKGLLDDDIILLCTDGLTNMVDKEEIYEIITNEKNELEKACNSLVERANENGGYDNISVVLIYND